MEDSGLEISRKAVLVVLFVPSVERDGTTAIDQEYWADAALRQGEVGLVIGDEYLAFRDFTKE